MKRFLLLIVFISVMYQTSNCQITNIVGGTIIDVSTAPWQVSLKSIASGNSHFCGGSIISNTWILTAAHCVLGQSASNIKVHCGTTNQTQLSNGQFVQASQIIIHPNYNTTTSDNDIALIRLATPLSFNQNVKSIEYASDCNILNSNLNPGVIGTLTGWGATTGSPPFSVTSILKGVQMPIISNSDANNLNGSSFSLSSNMIAFYQVGSGAAPGDSGGPAVINVNGKPILIGASSWGLSPKDQKPTIYTRIKNYADWIKNTSGINLFTPVITGPDQFCTSATYSIPNIPIGTTVTWSAANGLAIMGSVNANPVTVVKTFIYGGVSTLNATINNTCNSTVAPPKTVKAGPQTPTGANAIGFSNTGTGRASWVILFCDPLPGAINYKWYDENNVLFATTIENRVNSPGRLCNKFYVYRVAVTDNCGTSNQAGIYYTYTAGCNTANRLNTYPNPANTQLTVSYVPSGLNVNDNSIAETNEMSEAKQFEIVLYDDKGKKVSQQKNVAINKDITIDTQNIPNGTYFLHILDGKEKIEKQIIIQH